MSIVSPSRAIETWYKGYRFRSRLEARWAVAFDTIGIKWQYEPEGFLVGFGYHAEECEENTEKPCSCGAKGNPYLPDFYLPATETWVEVKGDVNTFDRALLADAVDWGSGLPGTEDSLGSSRGLLLLGPIPRATPTFWPLHPILQHSKGGFVELTRLSGGGPAPTAGYGQNYFDSTSGGLKSFKESWDAVARFWREDLGSNGFCPNSVVRAYGAARSARFEHGETPR